MTEDPTRAVARPTDPETPAHGSVGPTDPSADPATDPSMRRVQSPGQPGRRAPGLTRTRMSGLWTGLILSAIVLLFLLIFIVQNNVPVQINFLGLSGTLPTGVALLLAAIAGLLLVAIPGGLRILQLRRAAGRGVGR